MKKHTVLLYFMDNSIEECEVIASDEDEALNIIFNKLLIMSGNQLDSNPVLFLYSKETNKKTFYTIQNIKKIELATKN